MSILIKGMKMPKSCAECRFSGCGGLRNELVVCMFTGANALNTVQYLDDCPLIPVPPHGRLIDADALIADVRAHSESYFADDFAHEWVDVAPTIIEAEEGEHGEEKR